MAGALYHSVTKWEPTPMKNDNFLTPGRIGHVYFFPQKSYDTLKGKGAGWARKSCGGYVKDDLPSEKSSTPSSPTLSE